MVALSEIKFERIDGTPATLSDYSGKVLLLVNVASKCGLTPQYAQLEAFYRAHRERGLEILAFPANDFGAQEPGTNEEIASFCSLTYGVSFPLFSKIAVKGDAQHPLYTALIAAQPTSIDKPGSELRAKMVARGGHPNPSDVLWNFEKFLLNGEGNVVARFAPDITVEDELLASAIDRELNAVRA